MLNYILSELSYNFQYKFLQKYLKYDTAVMKPVQYQSCFAKT